MKLTLAILAGLFVGWWTGGMDKGSPGLPAVTPPSTHATPRAAPRDAEVQTRLRPLRESKSRAERLREIVILATNLPAADFERWYEGNHLEFLDGQMEGVFYAILDERWMEADPAGCARWMAKSGRSRMEPFLTRWLEADEAAAIAFVRGKPIKAHDRSVIGLVSAMARRDAAKALALFDEFSSQVTFPREALGEIAKTDRDAVLAHVRDWNKERKLGALTSIAGAWIEKDLPWVVAMLDAEGVGAKGFDDLVNHLGWATTGKAILKNAASLPEGWLEQMSGRWMGPLTAGCEIDWLERQAGVPGIPSELLAKIQVTASAGGFWYGERREPGRRLVEEGDWLPVEARVKLAGSLVSAWGDDPDTARAWVQGLGEPMKGAAEKGLAEMEKREAQKAATERRKTPEGLVEVLAGDLSGISLSQTGASWDDGALAHAVKLVGSMDGARAAELVLENRSLLRELPAEVAGSLVKRALSSGDQAASWTPESYRGVCELASQWAGNDPRTAGEWVAGLPAGEARLWAAKNVALQWDRHAPEEVRAWAKKLGGEEGAAVLEVLETGK